ncbi:MAG: DrmB family protein [Pseudonocardiaceae bacterium]
MKRRNLRTFTLPRDRNPLDHLIAEFWPHLEPLAGLPEPTAKQFMPTQTCWPELEPYGADRVWQVIRSRGASGRPDHQRTDELDLLAPEWDALASDTPVNLPDFTTWERSAAVRERAQNLLVPAHRAWCGRRRVDPRNWPGLRYVLLHTFAHALIREPALDSGYSAAGIGERIYARTGDEPMSGVLLYTAAPDSEGTLGGLVSLGHTDRLGRLIDRALEASRLCSSDPLCAEHDPRVHGRLYGTACHACLFAAETSCERGNQYLDRALLVDTLATTGWGFFA